ncbi:DNA topology modulation protein [Edaphobacillus lindanitolerans]|nr:DNA topology modulation protein [Edaphobacillus lindanitolerans]
MERIMLIGSGGAGKSTLARELGKRLNIQVHHLDALLWKPGWTLTTRDEQREIQRGLCGRDRWIVDGNYGATMDERIRAADTVIFLDMSRTVCLYRILKRRIRYHGRTRPDMQRDCPERLDLEFAKWVWNYPKEKRPGVQAMLDGLGPDKQVFILKNRKAVRAFLDRLPN